MRRIKTILLCLWVVANSFAATYQTYTPTDFRSTSAYVAGGERTSTPYTIHSTPITNRASGSMTAISAANFSTLNSEGGACYLPSATHSGPRKAGKVTEPDTEAVGEGVWESPVGDIPFILFALFVLIYVIVRRPKLSRCDRMNIE